MLGLFIQTTPSITPPPPTNQPQKKGTSSRGFSRILPRSWSCVAVGGSASAKGSLLNANPPVRLRRKRARERNEPSFLQGCGPRGGLCFAVAEGGVFARLMTSIARGRPSFPQPYRSFPPGEHILQVKSASGIVREWHSDLLRTLCAA